MIVLLYFDGLCEPVNPGGTGTYGFVVRDLPGHTEPVTGCGVVPAPSSPMTNNYAEYAALGKALAFVAANAQLGPGDELCVFGDSKLVVEQLAGNWECRAGTLRPLLARCRELLVQIGCRWSATWVPREQNTAADALSGAAYVGASGRPVPVRVKK